MDILRLKVTLVLLIEASRLEVNGLLFGSWNSYSRAGGYVCKHTKPFNIQFKTIGNIIPIRNKEVN